MSVRTPARMQVLMKACRQHFLFARLPEEQCLRIFSQMERGDILAGETVIRQGDPGTILYPATALP